MSGTHVWSGNVADYQAVSPQTRSAKSTEFLGKKKIVNFKQPVQGNPV